MNSKSIPDAQNEHCFDKGSSSSPAPPAGADQTERFKFLHLPLELRIQIYETAFSDYADTDHTNAKSPFGIKSRKRIKARVQAPKPLSVAMASKQIYRETLPLLYKTYHFRLSMWDDATSSPSGRQLTRQLLAQLRRPVALSMLPSIAYLDLFVPGPVAAFSERMSSVLRLINHSCVGLQTFRLHMEHLPRAWTHAAKILEAEGENKDSFEQEILNTLRGLAKRVRVFRINICLIQWYLHYDFFLTELIPGSAWFSNGDNDRNSWVCQVTEGLKSLTIWNK